MKKKEAKEIRKKRQEMQLAIWSKMSEEEKAKEIEARKEKSTADYRKRHEKEDAHQQMLKEGRAFAVKNQVRFFHWEIGDYDVVAGAMLKTGANGLPYYLVSYAICSSRDTFSLRTARGYVGQRLKNENHPYRFEIMLGKSGALSSKRLNAVCHVHVLMDVVSKRVRVPGNMERRVLACAWNEDMVHQ